MHITQFFTIAVTYVIFLKSLIKRFTKGKGRENLNH